MLKEMLKSKVYYATVTEAQLYYEGSVTIDNTIIKNADLSVHEKVEVLNLNNGERFQTYVIEGEEDSGVICLNGPAARKGQVGDKVILVSYCLVSQEELKTHKATYVVVDEKNRVRSKTLR